MPSEQGTPTTRTAAREAVLNTDELLERILFHVSGGDLLVRARRVCKKWKHTISESPAIQVKLWFTPQTTELLSPAGNWKDELKARKLSRRLEPDLDIHGRTAQEFPRYNRDTISRNDLVLFDKIDWSREPYREPSRLAPCFSGVTNGYLYISRKLDRRRKPGGCTPSWLDMNITLPRITVAWLSLILPVSDSGGRCSMRVEISLRQSTGVTFRHVMDVMHRAYRSHTCGTPYNFLRYSSEANAMLVFCLGR